MPTLAGTQDMSDGFVARSEPDCIYPFNDTWSYTPGKTQYLCQRR